MTAWTKLAIGLAAVSIAGGICLASVLWTAWVEIVGMLHRLIGVWA